MTVEKSRVRLAILRLLFLVRVRERPGVHGYHDGGAERIDLRPIDGMEMESILHGSRKPVECLER